MAATKGAMTKLSSPQTAFLSTVEESENNRINFRDSLKFFQEQLVINGANFPSPSSSSQSGNNTLTKNGSFSFKENNLEKSKASKDNHSFKEEIQSVRPCKIDIPTVDTILESVKVLRAIQKSQEERGSFWNLDVPTKSVADPSYRNDEIPITNENQNNHNNQDEEKKDETDTMTSEDKQNIAEMEIKVLQLDSNSKTNLASTSNSKTTEEICSFWPSNSLVINSYSETENTVKETLLPLEENFHHVNPDDYKTGDESVKAFSTLESNIKSDLTLDQKQKGNIVSNQTHQNVKHKNLLENSIANESKLQNNSNCDERENDHESLSELEQNYTHENVLESITDGFKEKQSESNSNKEQNDNGNLDQNENLINSMANELKLITDTNFDNGLSNEISGQTEQNDKHETAVSKNFTNDETENVNTVIEVCNTPESLSEVCTDFFDLMNFNRENETKETLLNELNSKSELLKIETYVDTDIHKPDFILNESIWKNNCSPNDRNSIRTEPYDNDSGFGTQRSGSSLSPNNHSQIQKDSWSDSCSSHYASAECSPYHSLNSVFESSSISTAGETNVTENKDILSDVASSTCEDISEKIQVCEKVKPLKSQGCNLLLQQTNNNIDKNERDNINKFSELDFTSGNAELDTEISYCNFITNYTIENPCKRTADKLQTSEICDNFEKHIEKVNDQEIFLHEQTTKPNTDEFLSTVSTEEKKQDEFSSIVSAEEKKQDEFSSIVSTEEKKQDEFSSIVSTEEKKQDEFSSIVSTEEKKQDEFLSVVSTEEKKQDDDPCDLSRTQKFTAASCDLISVVQSLYSIKENPTYQILPALDDHEERFEEELFFLSKGALCEFPEDIYLMTIKDSNVYIIKDSQILCSLNMKYGEISIIEKTILEINNKMGKSVYIQSDTVDLVRLKTRIEVNILKHWQTDCLQLVHYPLKCYQNVVIIDLGSCSTRAGILMDQPTLPSLFFPTICATDKITGTNVYGMEALQTEVRQHSNLSFPVRPTIKITKHTIDIDLLEGLFMKIFNDLKVDPTEYTIQVCLPRNLSINAQTALMKLLLEDLQVKAVSLSNQALLTLYAHEVSTAIVVDIGDRIDVLPVVDGFIVENGVTKLPHGGQRLIHHMKHGLAEKRISLSNDIDSFVVQYIIENLAYVAEDYEKEMQIATQYPDRIKKTITLQPASSENLPCKTVTLEEACFKVPEGLFTPDLWGLDSPGIHHLVQKAIQATSVDARKQIAENIYVSGGVTMLPGFVERLSKEMAKLSKTKIVPKVHASNYRYHCTYIGACKFAKMDVFPQVCVNLEDYSRNGASVLKKCALCF